MEELGFEKFILGDFLFQSEVCSIGHLSWNSANSQNAQWLILAKLSDLQLGQVNIGRHLLTGTSMSAEVAQIGQMSFMLFILSYILGAFC